MISIEHFRRLMLVIFVLTFSHINQLYIYHLPLNQVITNGNFNENRLRDVETILRRNGRIDVAQIIQGTMQGNLSRLEDFEQNFLPFRGQFHNANAHPPDGEWPRLLYNYTRNTNPVRQETQSGYTAQDTQGHSDGQNSRNERIGHRGRGPDPRPVLQRPSMRLENARSEPRQRNPSMSPQLPRPQGLLFPEMCCICGRNIQNVNSPHILSRITSIMDRLTADELQAFVDEVDKYDRGIFPSNQPHANTPRQIVDALERCNLRGEKCILCLLNYGFQRIGRSDLAREVREF